MSKISFERHIHFKYTPTFVEVWKQQPTALKTLLNTVARPFGYSGMNVFFVLVILYLVTKYGLWDYEPYFRIT